MKMLKEFMFMISICFCLFFNVAYSANLDLGIVAVGKASLKKIKYKIVASDKSSSKVITKIIKIIQNDLSFYKDEFALQQNVNASDLLVEIALSKSIKVNLSYLGKKINFGFELSKNKELDLRKVSHQISSNIYKFTMHKKSIFNSKIVFVSDILTKSRRKIIKEVYIMDFDGFNKKRLTFFNKIVLSPAFSYSGDKIVFSVIENFKNKKNINVYILNLLTKNLRRISSFKGINSGAVFTPDDKSLILTLSISGNAEIYKLNISSKKITRITRNYAPDVSPSIYKDKMVFLSGRAGKPMIYTASLNGLEKDVKRIGFVGKFNANPKFSPDGSQIVFSSWIDQRFDIFRLNVDGTGLTRLTKDFGSNETPSFLVGGDFFVFSSQHVYSKYRAVTNIYISTKTGEILGKLTKNFGNCQTASTSK